MGKVKSLMMQGKVSRRSRHAPCNKLYTDVKRMKNRAMRIARHMKKHPNDLQSKDATGAAGGESREAAWYTPRKNLYWLFPRQANKGVFGQTMDLETAALLLKRRGRGRVHYS